jgi:hypothetical protein
MGQEPKSETKVNLFAARQALYIGNGWECTDETIFIGHMGIRERNATEKSNMYWNS